jgi:hypothetical protein
MVITEGVHPTIGEVVWVWSEGIEPMEDANKNRWFRIKGLNSIGFGEVPVSIHQGKLIGLMIPKVLAGLNGIHANT